LVIGHFFFGFARRELWAGEAYAGKTVLSTSNNGHRLSPLLSQPHPKNVDDGIPIPMPAANSIAATATNTTVASHILTAELMITPTP